MFIFLGDLQLCAQPNMFNGKDGTNASIVIESQKRIVSSAVPQESKSCRVVEVCVVVL